MSNDATAVVMEQFCEPSVEGRTVNALSGLAHILDDGVASDDRGASATGATIADGVAHGRSETRDASTRASSRDGKATVSLTVAPVSGLLLLRAVKSASSLSDALQAHCGLLLSTRLQSATVGDYCIRWMSPDCWLLSCPLYECFKIETALREHVSGHVAIVNVSGGYTVLELQGKNARAVLMKSTAYDVHPDHFPEAKVVNTTFAKTQVTLRSVAADHYELIVRRSYSDYVWLWLQRAAAEYGLAIG